VGPEKRQPRGFEPPPWEREQFDEFQQQRAEQEAAEPAPQEEPAQAAPEQPTAVEEQSTPAASPEEGPPMDASDGIGAGGGIDEVQASQLLAGLKAEEPKSTTFYWLGLAAAIFLALVGAVLMIWGIVALLATQGKGTQGWLGAAGTIFFGILFIAIAGWVIYKNLQRQGVL
jgi:hypothetical protein